MKHIIFLLTLLLVCSCVPLVDTDPTPTPPTPTIRIGLVRLLSNRTVMHFGADGAYLVYDRGIRIADVEAGATYSATISGAQIIIRDNLGNVIGTYTGPIRIRPTDPLTTRLRIGPAIYALLEYRGELEISVSGNYLLAVSIVDKEEYLYSVVGAEMPARWPLEALKVQAVSARMFRDIQWGRRAHLGFDLKDTIMDQVYRGTETEAASTRQAVRDTADVVIKYQGVPVSLFYFSSCGGYTANNEDVWATYPLGHLRGVMDKDEVTGKSFCSPQTSGNLRYQWTYSESLSSLEAKLINDPRTAPANPAATLVDVNIHTEDGSGRARYVNIVYSDQIIKIPGNTFRIIVGSTLLQSTKWDFDPYVSGNRMHFAGKGFGHGVGMCQWGVHGMVLSGFNYREILHHYFTGITIIP